MLTLRAPRRTSRRPFWGSIVKHEFADATRRPEDIGIVLEGMEVLSGLGNVALATAMLLGLIYSLNLTYPQELRYTLRCSKNNSGAGLANTVCQSTGTENKLFTRRCE